MGLNTHTNTDLEKLDVRSHDSDEGDASLESVELPEPKESNNGALPSPSSSSSETSGTPIEELDWDSPADVKNPHNWPIWKRVFHTAIPALYGFVVTLATSAYVPSIPIIMAKFEVEREVAILPLSLYTFGFVVGPVFAAPLSELYGRRIIYWTTLPLLLIFTAIAGVSNNITQLIVNRFLAATFGSGSLAVGAGTIADIWSPTSNGRAAVFFILAPFLGPALGPLTGAYIIDEYNNNWRYSMWVVMIVAAPILCAAVFMQETSKQRILYLRQKAQGVKVPRKTGDTRLLLGKLQVAVTRPLHMMCLEPLVAFLSIYSGFAFAMMFSFFGSYSYVFQVVYGFNQKEVGLTFLGVLVGFLFAVVSFGIFDATLYKKAAFRAKAKPAPEHRLYTALLGSLTLPIGLFWFAWTPQKSIHWIVPVLAGIPFGLGSLGIFISVTTYLVDVYQAKNGASAVAANGILRYTLGAIFPLFTLQMYEALGIHWAGSVFAFVALALLPMPWFFYFHGHKLRMRSKYDTFKG
ncbi:MFS general substrate transporter [Venustampulla echinocandica]|uniref:MFS general substrate transporter n=1 Tax=Venustampulla echinocandica TaxID=2656787 RepID=A0A370TAU2_9HELO|nr:MFS general substrate transporter [Venustampulla echinocandica]RDL31047.1 MFS general substrate transporter [Venustampulla echinocandica]